MPPTSLALSAQTPSLASWATVWAAWSAAKVLQHGEVCLSVCVCEGGRPEALGSNVLAVASGTIADASEAGLDQADDHVLLAHSAGVQEDEAKLAAGGYLVAVAVSMHQEGGSTVRTDRVRVPTEYSTWKVTCLPTSLRRRNSRASQPQGYRAERGCGVCVIWCV